MNSNYNLGGYDQVVDMLITCLIQNSTDRFFGCNDTGQQLDNLITINMIIATLQKLSLK